MTINLIVAIPRRDRVVHCLTFTGNGGLFEQPHDVTVVWSLVVFSREYLRSLFRNFLCCNGSRRAVQRRSDDVTKRLIEEISVQKLTGWIVEAVKVLRRLAVNQNF